MDLKAIAKQLSSGRKGGNEERASFVSVKGKKELQNLIYLAQEHCFLTKFRLYMAHLELVAMLAGKEYVEGFADKFNNDKEIIKLLKNIFKETSHGTKK